MLYEVFYTHTLCWSRFVVLLCVYFYFVYFDMIIGVETEGIDPSTSTRFDSHMIMSGNMRL